MSSTEATATTPAAGETSGTPSPASPGSEMNAVPAGDASKEKNKSKVPAGSTSNSLSPEKTGSKSGARGTPSLARTVAPDKDDAGKDGEGEGGDDKQGSDAESEYETICIRRKKPTPLMQRMKRLLLGTMAFDLYACSVMYEAFKLLVITSQFNWALEILAGLMHIMVAAGKCALKKQCTASGQRKKSDSPDTDTEKTPEPDKKASMKSSGSKQSAKPGGSPSLGKSQSKSGPTGTTSEPPTTSTTESGEAKATSEGPTTETSEGAAEATSAASPVSSP